MCETRVAFVGAHFDEIECECPIMVKRLRDAGAEVLVIEPIGGPNWRHTRERDLYQQSREEAIAAAEKMGVHKVINDFSIGQVAFHQEEIAEVLTKELGQFNPEIAFIHAVEDFHQDHVELARLSFRVLRQLTNFVREAGFRSALREVYSFPGSIGQMRGFNPDFLLSVLA